MSEFQHPHIVDWAITSRCNLSCRHCRGFSVDELSTGRARELISEIASLKPGWVIVEGGEPLLRGDLFELLELMRWEGLEVHLITNGMLLDSGHISLLKDLGVRVMISIDGTSPATYEEIRIGASFDQALAAARQCVCTGLLEAINFTVIKQNYREIAGILELAADIGAGKVTFIGLKPCQGYAEELLTPAEYEAAIGAACRGAQQTGVEIFFDEPFFWSAVREWGLPEPVASGEDGILAPATSACVFGEYLFIETSGDVRPCSFAPMTLDNVNNKKLGEIWHEMLVSPFIERIRDPKSRTGACRDCRYLAECKGCRSRTFVLAGDWLAADPVCPLSHRMVGKEE